MGPNTPLTAYEAGGLRSKPILGSESEVELSYQIAWNNLIRSHVTLVVHALSFMVLAIVAFSLILFDSSDRVYLWMGVVFTFTAVISALRAFDLWTQHVSILQDKLIVQSFLGPLVYLGWFTVWWVWFDRKKPEWMPIAAAGLTLINMVASMAFVLRSFDVAFELLSLISCLLFFILLLWVIIPGIRRRGLEGWLVLPAVVLLMIEAFGNKLSLLHILPIWFFFGARITLALIASLILAAFVALLLLHRLLLSVRRQRLIELDAKRAQIQSDFVAAVSHEFRSPLTTLRTITELLVEGRIADESRRQQSYEYLKRETGRLHRLVEDLLDFGRMESGRKQYRITSHNAFQLVRGALAEFAEQARASGFSVESTLPSASAHQGATVQVDEEAVRRAVRNLLDNAMKYSPECHTIWVSGSVEDKKVYISVRDQGMGIGADEQQAIFQKFVRGSAAKEAGIKGTGIGLAMVRQIVEGMNGEVRIESQIGVGSTFTLVRPLAEN
jgi:signal transduction histidine kinase